MEPRESLVSSFRLHQQVWDEEQHSTYEAERRVAHKVQKARSIAEAVALYNGGHIYSGRDALNRDYYSDWVNINPVDDMEEVFLQARLTREYVILRKDLVETGMEFKNVGIDVRLFDCERRLCSPTDTDFYKFSSAGITKKTDGEPVNVLPGIPEWTEIDDLLDQLNTALINAPQQEQLVS